MLVPSWTQGGTEVPQILPWDLSLVQIPIHRGGQETLALQVHSSSQAYSVEALPWWLES